MQAASRGGRAIGLLILALIGFSGLPAIAQTQTAATADEWITRLAGLETAPDLDLAALRQQAMDRIKSRADAAPIKRPPLAPQLLKLPQFVADIQFDEDAAVIRPDSYRTLGRIADTLTHPSLLGYKFLIVGHTPSTGRRENNLMLSQRRADVIREVLINTFKISPKRLQAVGLGEEQLLDSARPNAPANQQVHVMTVGENESGPIASRPSPTATAPRPAATTRHRR
jgi:outer membrane protein OmpA-like peptidoglycan-associated protein